MDFAVLLGKTLINIEVNDAKDEIIFTEDGGQQYVMLHHQNCCETVEIESIVGDLADLIGTPILLAEEAESDEPAADAVVEYRGESETWTFYKLATIKGYVDIRWYGTSNGYYSESVSFYAVKKGH